MPRILVVDDDRAIQDMLVDTLSERGYDVFTCRDGRQTLAELTRQPYDLMILDVLIPHMNGFVLMERVRENPLWRDLPVIMVSGIYRSRNHRAEMTSRHQVIEYFDKPLPMGQLLDLVARVVGPGGSAAAVSDAPVTLDRPKADPVPLTQIKPALHAPRPVEEPPAPPAHLLAAEARDEQIQVEDEARKSFRTSAFLIQGALKKTPVAAVLGKLWEERTSGALLLRRDKLKKIVYLRKGDPYAVKSNAVNECLGQILVRERLITNEECTASLAQMKETDQRQGEILVQMKCITEKNLAFALELQLETKLFETFAWEDGEYRFNPSAALPPSDVALEWRGPAVVVEGIRRTYDETRLRRLMLPIFDVPLAFRYQNVDLTGMRFTPREEQAVQAIMPPKTARELIDSTSLDPPDTLRVIYTLIALQILAPAT